jgi:hypothetical protein
MWCSGVLGSYDHEIIFVGRRKLGKAGHMLEKQDTAHPLDGSGWADPFNKLYT